MKREAETAKVTEMEAERERERREEIEPESESEEGKVEKFAGRINTSKVALMVFNSI
jgi:hypothetical protein